MKPLTFAYSPATAGVESDILSVYIDGVGSSQMRPGIDITELLNDDSDLLIIELPADRRFSKKNVLRAIHCHPRYRDHRGTIRIVGLSMGALLGHDLIEYSKARRRTNKFELVVIDAPTGVSDLQNKLAKWLKFVPHWLLWLLSFLPTPLDRWLSKKLLDDGTTAPHENGLDDEYLAILTKHEARSKSIPFSGWLRHLKYLVSHKGPRSSVLTGVNMVVVQSEIDPLVIQPQAHDKWRATRGVPIRVVYVDAPGHGLLLEFPGRYADGLDRALDVLRLAA